jgi:hypothetical protein
MDQNQHKTHMEKCVEVAVLGTVPNPILEGY